MRWDLDHDNLATHLNATVPPSRVRDPVLVRDIIQRRVGALLDQRRGGTLYIPAVDGGQLWVDVRPGSLRIPPEIAVVLAPGVVLVPVRSDNPREAEHRLEIAGVFRAPLATVFATPGWFARNEPAAAGRFQVAEVGLTSRRLERVYPEWWGAADPRDVGRRGDDEALAAAVAAATLGRWSVDASDVRHALRALPIELRGSYELAAPWVIEASMMAAGGVALRGAPSAPDVPTLRCTPSFQPERAMIEVAAEAESVTIEDLCLDAGGLASACVSLADAPTALSPAQRKHLLLRCTFQGARDALVSYTDARALEAPPAEEDAFTRVTESLRVEHCRFLPRDDGAAPGAALRLVAPTSVSVDVRGCTFVGRALAMVYSASCSVSLANCHFRNDQAPTQIGDRDPDDALHRRGPEGGLDVYLGLAGRWPTGTLYAQDCRSNSVQFLATARASSGPQGDCTLIGLHHTRSTLRWHGHLRPLDPPLRPPPLPDGIEPTPILPLGKLVSPMKAPSPRLPGVLTTIEPLKVLHPPKRSDPPKVTGDTSQLRDLSTPPDPDSLLFNANGVSYDVSALGMDGATGRYVAPIHWHLPSSVTLMGCRFDKTPGDTSPAVDAFISDGRVIDLGIVGQLEVADPLVRVVPGAQHVTLEAIDARSS